jgi:chemotaxis protein MotC
LPRRARLARPQSWAENGDTPFFVSPGFGGLWPASSLAALAAEEPLSRPDTPLARAHFPPPMQIAQAAAAPELPSAAPAALPASSDTPPEAPAPAPSAPNGADSVGRAQDPVAQATPPAAEFAAASTPSPRVSGAAQNEGEPQATASSAPKADAHGGGKAAPPAPPKPADLGPPKPSRLVRALQRLQARLGAGDATAQAAQGALVAELEAQFEAADPAVWTSRREAAAQMVLLLSGGDPRPARRRAAAGQFGENADLVVAGLAFAEGDATRARSLLAGLDLEGVGDLARGQALLTAATLWSAGRGADPAKADALFDAARLAAPGTLTEETALRRQTRLAETRGDLTRFGWLASRHLRRFPRSIYAPAFRALLPEAAGRLAARIKDPTLAPLEPMLVAMTTQERMATLDALARHALAQGHFPFALAAARRALEIAPSLTLAADRAAMFALVATALEAGPDVRPRLAAARAPDAETEALRQAALAFVNDVYEWPPRALPTPADADRIEPPPGLARAAKSLAEGEALLARRSSVPSRLASAQTTGARP